MPKCRVNPYCIPKVWSLCDWLGFVTYLIAVCSEGQAILSWCPGWSVRLTESPSYCSGLAFDFTSWSKRSLQTQHVSRKWAGLAALPGGSGKKREKS